MVIVRKSRQVAISAVVVLVITGVWGLLDTRPAAGLLFFPDNLGDAVFHFASAALLAVALLVHGRVYIPRSTKGDHRGL